MPTDTAKTTQQEQWGLFGNDLDDARLVRVPSHLGKSAKEISADVQTAMFDPDPANVLNIDAYPAVVEALQNLVSATMTFYEADRMGLTRAPVLHKQAKQELFDAANDARPTLAAVHPAQAAKEEVGT